MKQKLPIGGWLEKFDEGGQLPSIVPTDALRTFDFANTAGTKQTKQKNKEIHNTIIHTPNLPMAGNGESWDEATNRVIPTLKNIVDSAPANTTLVTHNSVFGLIDLWNKQNRPDQFSKEQREKYTKQDGSYKTGDNFTIQGVNGPIHVVRHGETEDNQQHNFRSDDTELTSKGIKQAQSVGKKLGDIDIPQIITSPLDRAVNTANIIAEHQDKKKEEIAENGWLSKYDQGGDLQEHQPNFNEASVSMPEGFEGIGNLTSGYNYNPSWNGQFQDGGIMNTSVPEVTVYGKANYNKLQADNEVKKAKFLTDMSKYKKDSAEWINANKGYQDSLKLFNNNIINQQRNQQSYNDSLFIHNGWEKLNKDYENAAISATSVQDWREKNGEIANGDNYINLNKALGRTGEQPSSYDQNYIQRHFSDGSGFGGFIKAFYKMPTSNPVSNNFTQPVQPIQPIPPTNTSSTIKYDPKYEDLKMRSLWANQAKADTTAKVGVLDPLDYNDPTKGFTIGQASKFPQEVKDQFGLNYIDTDILPKKEMGGELNSTPIDATRVDIPKYKVTSQEEQDYYNPQVEKGITSGDWKQDMLYNNQWLFNTPIIGNIIKNKAYDVAKYSGGDPIIKQVKDIIKDPRIEGFGGNYGIQSSGDGNNRAKPITNLVDQYFNKTELPTSSYTPTSNYMNFLKSYSVKEDFNTLNPQQQQNIFKKGLDENLFENSYNKGDNSGYNDAINNSYNNFIKDKKSIYVNYNNDHLDLGVNLAGHKEGIAWDNSINKPYMSISDAWDFEPEAYSKKWTLKYDPAHAIVGEEARQKSKIQSTLMHRSGQPFKVYDRFYFDPQTRQYIPDDSIQSLKKSKGITPIQDEMMNKDISKWFPTMQTGGSIPGSVGFTYARTGAPSNGKYAKKTKPSAQTGTELSPKEFTSRMITSPKYKERLTNAGYKDVSGTINSRSANVAKTNTIYQDSIPGFTKQLYNQVNDIPFSDIGSAYIAPNVIVDKKQAADLKTSLPSIETHEYGHSELQRGLNEYDSSGLKGLLKKEITGEHDISPYENKADINALRYELYNKGKDVFTKDVAPADLQQLKNSNSYSVKRLFEHYDDDKLLWLLNNIASNQQPDKNSMQNGGEMQYYQNGLDFLPKSISQNGSTISQGFTDTGTRLLHALSSFGGSAIGDAVEGVSPGAADWLEKYSLGFIPHTSQEQLQANRSENPDRWMNRTGQIAGAISNVALGEMMGAGMQKTAPYIAKGLNQTGEYIDAVGNAFKNNELYKVNPLAGKIDPTKAYAPISAQKAENIMNTGLIYRGTKSGEATHYLPKYDEEGYIDQFVPKYEKQIYGQRTIDDNELINVTFGNGKKIQMPVANIKSGALSKYKNVNYEYNGKLLPVDRKTNTPIFSKQPTVPYSGTSSPDMKFKVGDVPDYSQFGISNQYVLETDPNQLVKGAYKKPGSKTAGFPFKLSNDPLQSGDWGIPRQSVIRGEYPTLGENNSRILKLDPIWGYGEVTDPDKLLQQSKGVQGILDATKTAGEKINNVLALAKPADVGAWNTPGYIKDRMNKFGIINTIDANPNIPAAAYFLHPSSPTKYNNLNELIGNNRYPYLYSKPKSYQDEGYPLSYLPPEYSEYFNTANQYSTIPPTKREALLMQKYTHEFSGLLNHEQKTLIEGGLKQKELDQINKRIVNGISKNKLQNVDVQHLTGNTLSDNLNVSDLTPGQEFELNRPLSTSYGNYDAAASNNVISLGGKYKFHINTGDKSKGMFLDAKGMPGSYMLAEKEVLLPPSKYKVNKIEGNNVYLDLLHNLPKKEEGGVIKDDRGQWDFPGQITEINSNNITMQGVPYNVLGVSDKGDTKMMQPNKNYKFRGKKVTEYPIAENGKQLKLLDQLQNFNNFGQSKKNWLEKYQ